MPTTNSNPRLWVLFAAMVVLGLAAGVHGARDLKQTTVSVTRTGILFPWTKTVTYTSSAGKRKLAQVPPALGPVGSTRTGTTGTGSTTLGTTTPTSTIAPPPRTTTTTTTTPPPSPRTSTGGTTGGALTGPSTTTGGTVGR